MSTLPSYRKYNGLSKYSIGSYKKIISDGDVIYSFMRIVILYRSLSENLSVIKLHLAIILLCIS